MRRRPRQFCHGPDTTRPFPILAPNQLLLNYDSFARVRQ